MAAPISNPLKKWYWKTIPYLSSPLAAENSSPSLSAAIQYLTRIELFPLATTVELFGPK